MENTNEKIFGEGFRFEAPSEATKEKAPWIKGKLGIEVSNRHCS